MRIRRRPVTGRGWNIERLESRRPLTAELVGHWTAESLTSTVESGDFIAEWPDLIRQIPAIAAGQPTLIASALNGRAAIRFDPSDQTDLFRVPAARSPLADAEDFSIAVVFASSASDLVGTDENWYFSSGIVDAHGLGLVNDWGLAIDHNGRLAAGMGSPPRTVRSREIGFNDGLAHVAIVTRDGSVLTLYVDGQSAAVSDASSAPRAARDIKFGAGGFPFHGDIPEIRLYRGSLLAAEVGDLTQDLLTTYLNLPPTPAADIYAAFEDQPVHISNSAGVLANDLDPDGDSLVASVLIGPLHGALELQGDGAFVYVPAQDYAGLDSFTYEVFDGTHRRQADVTLEILDQPDLPRSIANVYWLQTDAAFTVGASDGVLSNDWHPDQLALSAQIVQSTANGDLQLRSDGSFQYRPKPGFVGTDHFRYLATDGTNTSTPVEVQLIVQAGTVAISEIMAANRSSLLDEDRESSDWFELWNYGVDPINLRGWFLSDNSERLTKWKFPAIVLAPGEHRVVFASGKNRRPSEGELHTSFRLDSEGESLALVLPDGETVVSQVTDFAAQWPDIAYGIPRTSQGPGQIDSAEFDYLVNPTPGELNALPQPAFGPQITHVEHFPKRLEVGQALRVTARIAPREFSVDSVSIQVRLMYGEERTLPMVDDGTGQDGAG